MEETLGNLTYTIDIKDYAKQQVHVHIEADIVREVDWEFTGLVVKNGVDIHQFRVEDPDGNALQILPDEQGSFRVPATRCTVQYTLASAYNECMGADKLHNFVYPYMNAAEREVFLGTGALAYPMDINEPYPDYRVRVKVTGIPEGFNIFSSLLLDEIDEYVSDDKLGSFFLYAGKDLQPLRRIYTLVDGTPFELQLLIERGKTIPFTVDELLKFAGEYLKFVEETIAPYAQLPRIHLLMLQAPPNFTEVANNRTFATGENVPNGIVAYAPQDANYLNRIFGYNDYTYYMYEGFVHEMMHFYTTCSSNRVKAAIFAAPDCSRHDCFMIGEVLAAYFHNMYMMKYYKGDVSLFITEYIVNALNHWQLNQQRSYSLDWFVFDMHLRYEHDVTLLEVFREMVKEKQRDRTPYTSLDWVFDVLKRMGIEVDAEERALLSKRSAHPNYERIVRESLRLLGYDLIREGKRFTVVKSPHNVPELTFDFGKVA